MSRLLPLPALIYCALLASGSNAAEPVSGQLRPNGLPQSPSRTEIGGQCIVDLEQAYRLSGDLAGNLDIDFRIHVAGPCGSPPGTYRESWIAMGSYEAGNCRAEVAYLADVESGGEVVGRLVMQGHVNGTVQVSGRFQDGHMIYRGEVRRLACNRVR